MSLYNEIEYVFRKFGTCYSFKGYAVKIKKLGKYEMFDECYNSLLGAIKVFLKKKSIMYPKGCFFMTNTK
jgi:hypothetical protein